MIHLQHMVNIMNNPNMYKTKKFKNNIIYCSTTFVVFSLTYVIIM